MAAGLTAGLVVCGDVRPAAAQTAQAAINAFAASPNPNPSLWPHIDKDRLIGGLRARVEDPCRVNQGRRSLCGPAAIVHELARLQPTRYVAMARALFETGVFDDGSTRITPSGSLLNSNVPPSMDPADWLMLAALRDDKNRFYVVEFEDDPGSFEEGISGLTTPGDMEDWTRDVLGFTNVGYESTYLWGENGALRKADRASRADGVGFLMIDSAMLPDGEASWIAYPNHWVAYKPGELHIVEGDWDDWRPWDWDTGHVSFNVFSWGSCSNPVEELREGKFEDYMWGAVTGAMLRGEVNGPGNPQLEATLHIMMR